MLPRGGGNKIGHNSWNITPTASTIVGIMSLGIIDERGTGFYCTKCIEQKLLLAVLNSNSIYLYFTPIPFQAPLGSMHNT